MISVYEKKEACFGCYSCQLICPTDAIRMIEDEEGFKYPLIDQDKCIDCGKCQKACSYINPPDRVGYFDQAKAFGGKHLSQEIRMSSTSGGAFTAISNHFYESYGKENCIVYGAVYDEGFLVKHKRGLSSGDRDEMRGAKYVKSDLSDTYALVAKDLAEDKHVLFSGTGCDVAGLKQFLKVKGVHTEKLVSVDIICHGTPSPKIWKDYLRWIQSDNTLKTFTFRNKDKAWRGFQVTATYEDGTSKTNTPKLLSYVNMYGAGLTMRPSCHQCPYAITDRVGDITLGDFWGIEKTLPEMDDGKGVSVILCSTEVGAKLLNSSDLKLELQSCDLEGAKQYNLRQATRKGLQREQLFIDYKAHGYAFIAKKYGAYSIYGQLRKLAGKMLRSIKR